MSTKQLQAPVKPLQKLQTVAKQRKRINKIIKTFKMASLNIVLSSKLFGGYQKIFSHQSKLLKCKMNFAVYFPPQYGDNENIPVLYWLSGLTCDETNFIKKSGGQKYAAQYGIAIVCPDTSPRNLDIPGQDDSCEIGYGAGFYVNATREPWSENYHMFNYVSSELIDVIQENFPGLSNKQSICGHSMGGHGAIITALKNPGLFRSVSAFAPISNPINCPLAKKAFTNYLGDDTGKWKEWDSTELVKQYNGPQMEIFIDQGTGDDFYKDKQLLPENLVESCKNSQMPCILQLREDYDHSYFYVSTFIEEHIAYHAKFLK